MAFVVAKDHLQEHGENQPKHDWRNCTIFTSEEIALAEQLYKTELFVQELQGKVQPMPPALTAFFKKTERVRQNERNT